MRVLDVIYYIHEEMQRYFVICFISFNFIYHIEQGIQRWVLFSCLKIERGLMILKLTLKQKRFADEYIISGNAYQAAISAGYSENYAKNASTKMVENSGEISRYINERLKELADKKIAKQDEVLTYLTSVMRGEETEQTLYGMGEGMQGIAEIQVGARDRIKAAELLGKRYGTWTDKLDVQAEIQTMVVDDVEED